RSRGRRRRSELLQGPVLEVSPPGYESAFSLGGGIVRLCLLHRGDRTPGKPLRLRARVPPDPATERIFGDEYAEHSQHRLPAEVSAFRLLFALPQADQ